jgi:adenosylcobinamide-phosphate synthase
MPKNAYIALSALPLSFVAELLIGGLHYKIHPVNLIGRLIKFYENILYKISNGIFSGILFNIANIISVLSIFILIFFQLAKIGYSIYLPVYIYIIASFISTGGLKAAAKKIYSDLSGGNIDQARGSLISLVGRDSKNLSEAEISRAVIESLAENTGDGIGSVLFYYGILGIYGVLFYKTANTMDSIVGYRNKKYEKFGKFSAKLDDVLNFIPFRITGFFMILSILILQIFEKSKLSVLKLLSIKHNSHNYNFIESLRAYAAYKNFHPSPNGGHLEAIMAGGLKIKLGGANFYGGIKSNRPEIGFEDYGMPSKNNIIQAINIMMLTSVIAVIFYDFIFYFVGIYFIHFL